MESYIRTPKVVVEIRKIDYTKTVLTVTKTYRIGFNEIDDLVACNFSEALVNPEGPFSLTLLPTIDSDGYSWLDKIEPSDMVLIEMIGKTRYAGIVEECRMSAAMSDSGPRRNVSVTGYGLGGLLARLQVITDLKLFSQNGTAESISKMLQAKLSAEMEKGKPYANILKEVYKNFMDLAAGVNSPKVPISCGMKSLVDGMITLEFSEDVKTQYPVVFSYYSTGANNIWSLWMNMVQAPAAEMFGYFKSGDKYVITFRNNPYSPDVWQQLEKTKKKIPRLLVTNCDLGLSSKEVNSLFLAVLPGSGLSLTKTQIADHQRNQLQVDQEAWAKYGYRPMFPEFRYYKRDGLTKDTSTSNDITELSKNLAEWYGHMDKMYSGSISLMAVDDPDVMEWPHIGEVMEFIGGEFYLEGADYSWRYGEPIEARLNVTRGAIYKDGKFDKKIPKVGGII